MYTANYSPDKPITTHQDVWITAFEVWRTVVCGVLYSGVFGLRIVVVFIDGWVLDNIVGSLPGWGMHFLEGMRRVAHEGVYKCSSAAPYGAANALLPSLLTDHSFHAFGYIEDVFGNVAVDPIAN